MSGYLIQLPSSIANTLIEQAGSGKLSLGDTLTYTQLFRGYPYSYVRATGLGFPKGASGSGVTAGMIVRTSSVTKEKGNIGLLEINWAANSGASDWTLPSDRFGCKAIDLNPRIESHRLFNGLSPQDFDQVRAANNASSYAERNTLAGKITNPLAQKLYAKLRQGIESYYLPAFEYTWTYASFSAPSLNRGGYIETPGGPLAGNLPAGQTWLRKADSLEFNDWFCRTTRTWIGAPIDDLHYWDPDLYY